MPDIVITTARADHPELASRAARWGQWLDAPVVLRNGRNVERLCAENQARGVVVVTADRTTYYEPEAGVEYFFHPNLASVRIHNLRVGLGDQMVQAMELEPGDAVLDCTMGRASDCILCASVVGETGRVVGVEKVPVVAYLTVEGLQISEFVSPRFTELMRRVDARCADYNDFLPTCDDASFDVVYFDPPFHRPITESLSMADLRALAHKETINEGAVREALRVARRSVIIKQRRGTALWRALGVEDIHGGRCARVEYGVLRPGHILPTDE
jgi:16S rRNA (guanine1516-N2)-methyltransferase